MRFSALFILLVIFVFIFHSFAWAEENQEQPEHEENEILIEFRLNLSLDEALRNKDLRKILKKLGKSQWKKIFHDLGREKGEHFVRVDQEGEHSVDLNQFYKFHIEQDGEDLPSLLSELKKLSIIKSVSPNYLLEIQETPDDPYYSSQGAWGQSYEDLWGLHNMDLQNAWDVSTGSDDIVVAVIDTGLDFGHEDIQGNVFVNATEKNGRSGIDDDGNGYVDDVSGYDFYNNDSNPTDDHGHGTHVSGTIAAVGNNRLGITGVMWNARILPLKGCNQYGGCSTSSMANAVYYAVEMGADVINMSVGGSGSSTLQTAIEYAYSQGVVVVAAAGNSAAHAHYYFPAYYPEVFAVGSSTYLDTRSIFSNYGMQLDFLAPGGGYDSSGRYTSSTILSLNAYGTARSRSSNAVDGKYYRSGGTSMATPHAAGLAGLLLSVYPNLTVEELRQALRMGADDVEDIGHDAQSGFGRLNASHTLNTNHFCEAYLHSPQNYSVVRGDRVQFKGSVGGQDFASYELVVKSLNSQKEWRYKGNQSRSQSLLMEFDSKGTWGGYQAHLKVFDISGVICGEDHKVFQVSPTLANWSIQNDESASLKFGYDLASADFNKDGYEDLLVGAPNCHSVPACSQSSGLGKVYLIWGGTSPGANQNITQIEHVSWRGLQTYDRLGLQVETADVDGDGVSDVILGVPGDSTLGTYNGKICAFLGKNSGSWNRDMSLQQADFCLSGEAERDRLGFYVSRLGDVDGDKKEDFITSACGQDAGGSDYGKAYVIYGRDVSQYGVKSSIAQARNSMAGVHSLAELCFQEDWGRGLPVSTAGDVNGDGYDDVLISSPLFSNHTGIAFLFFGSSQGISGNNLSDADVVIYNTYPGGSKGTRVGFGASVAGVGDVNDDGFDDFVIGFTGASSGKLSAGMHLIYGRSQWGSSVSLSSLQPVTLEEGGYKDQSYFSPVGLGDLNQDGFADFAFGAYGYLTSYPSGFYSSGLVYSYLGGIANFKLNSMPWAASLVYKEDEFSSQRDRFGFSLAAVDFNGNQQKDVAIAALGDVPSVSIFDSADLFQQAESEDPSVSPPPADPDPGSPEPPEEESPTEPTQPLPEPENPSPTNPEPGLPQPPEEENPTEPNPLPEPENPLPSPEEPSSTDPDPISPEPPEEGNSPEPVDPETSLPEPPQDEKVPGSENSLPGDVSENSVSSGCSLQTGVRVSSSSSLGLGMFYLLGIFFLKKRKQRVLEMAVK